MGASLCPPRRAGFPPSRPHSGPQPSSASGSQSQSLQGQLPQRRGVRAWGCGLGLGLGLGSSGEGAPLRGLQSLPCTCGVVGLLAPQTLNLWRSQPIASKQRAAAGVGVTACGGGFQGKRPRLDRTSSNTVCDRGAARRVRVLGL